jgi:hypothetical protein
VTAAVCQCSHRHCANCQSRGNGPQKMTVCAKNKMVIACSLRVSNIIKFCFVDESNPARRMEVSRSNPCSNQEHGTGPNCLEKQSTQGLFRSRIASSSSYRYALAMSANLCNSANPIYIVSPPPPPLLKHRSNVTGNFNLNLISLGVP